MCEFQDVRVRDVNCLLNLLILAYLTRETLHELCHEISVDFEKFEKIIFSIHKSYSLDCSLRQ